MATTVQNEALCKYKYIASNPSIIPNFNNKVLYLKGRSNDDTSIWIGMSLPKYKLPQNTTQVKIKYNYPKTDKISIGVYFTPRTDGTLAEGSKIYTNIHYADSENTSQYKEIKFSLGDFDYNKFKGIGFVFNHTNANYKGKDLEINISQIQFLNKQDSVIDLIRFNQMTKHFNVTAEDLFIDKMVSNNRITEAKIQYKNNDDAIKKALELSKGDMVLYKDSYKKQQKSYIWNGDDWHALNNIDEVVQRLQTSTDYQLNTSSKNIVQAINEVNSNAQASKSLDLVPLSGFYNAAGLKYSWEQAKVLVSSAFNDEDQVIGDNAQERSYFASHPDFMDIQKIVFPAHMWLIGEYAFKEMPLLQKIVLSDITQINDSAFENCWSLNTIDFSDKIKRIGYKAFFYSSTGGEISSNLYELTLPSSLNSIGEYAFSGTQIKDIYYEGSSNDWEWIDIGGSNSTITYATKHYNQALATREFVLANAVEGVITEQLLTEAPLEIVDELDENADKTGKKLLRAALDYDHSFEFNEHGVLQLKLGEGLGYNETGTCVSREYIRELLGDAALIRDIYPDRAILENDEPPYEIYPSNVIYMIPSESEDGTYDEYMNVNNKWEQIGSTAINLSNYQTKTDNDLQTNNKSLVGAINELKGLIDSYWETINEVLEDVY